MKITSKTLLVGLMAFTLGGMRYARAQSAVWAGGSGNWFGGGANWDCVSGATLSPCTAPNGSSWTAAIGTMLNGSTFTGNVTADAPVNLGLLAVGTGATGSLTVPTAGSGSASYQINVGSQGILTINGGATLSSLLLTADSGSVNVTGSGSSLTSTNTISVGATSGSSGAMTVQNGGLVSSMYGQVGSLAGATGTASITGAGSQWMVNETFNIGTGGGPGTLTVSNGAQVGSGVSSTGLSTLVGTGTGSMGAVLVNGGYFNTQGLVIGGSGGTGTMTVTDSSVSASGIVEIGNQGTLALDSGTFAVGNSFTLDSGGALRFGIGSATGYPLLNISNDIGDFNGTIDFDFINGFAPAAGETFNLIFSDGAPDNFSGATYEVTGLQPGFQYALLNEPAGLEFEALNSGVSSTGTPEPSNVGMIAFAMFLAGLRFTHRLKMKTGATAASAAPACRART